MTPVLAELVFPCDPKGSLWVWFLRPGTPGPMRAMVPVGSPALVGAAHLLLPSCGAAAPPGQLHPLPRWRQTCKNMPLAKKMGWRWLRSWLNHPQGGKVCKEKGLHRHLPKRGKQRVSPWLGCSGAGLGGCVAAVTKCKGTQKSSSLQAAWIILSFLLLLAAKYHP